MQRVRDINFLRKSDIMSITYGTLFCLQEAPLEITWKHLADTDGIPPVSMIKERFCAKLEKDDCVAALTCITNNPPKDLQPFSKSSWLNLFKENSERFQKGTLVRLMNEANNMVSSSSMPNPALVYLLQSYKEIFCATENKLVANSR